MAIVAKSRGWSAVVAVTPDCWFKKPLPPAAARLVPQVLFVDEISKALKCPKNLQKQISS